MGQSPPQSSLILWLKSDAGVLQSDGGVAGTGVGIATWQNQAAGWSDATQSDSNLQPSFQPNVVNGKPAVRFNPGGGANANDDVLSLAIQSLPSTISSYAVLKREFNDQSPATGRDRILAGGAGAYQFAAFDSGLDQPPIGVHVGLQGTSNATSSFPVDDQFRILGARIDGTQAVLSLWELDGTLIATETQTFNVGGFSASGYMIGGRPDSPTGNQNLDGDLAELLVYTSFLSSQDESAIVQYLVQHYTVPEPQTATTAVIAIFIFFRGRVARRRSLEVATSHG
jgi:hypothetical protein